MLDFGARDEDARPALQPGSITDVEVFDVGGGERFVKSSEGP